MALNPNMPDSAGIDSEEFDSGTRTEEREEQPGAEPMQNRPPVEAPAEKAPADEETDDTFKGDDVEDDEGDEDAKRASDAAKELAGRKRGLEGRKQTIQQQINDLVRQRGEETRETARGRQEREALQRDIERLRDTRDRVARGEQVERDPRERREQDDPRRFDPRQGQRQEAPDPRDPKPQEAQFDDFAQYAEAVGRWGARQEVARVEQERSQRAQQSARAQWETKRQEGYRGRYDAFAKANPDFETEVNRDDLILTAPMVDAIKDSEQGPQMMLHLARNPSDIDRISRLHPVLAFGEMKKIEARLEGAHSGSPQSQPTQHSKAPAPIKPVESSTSRGSGHNALDIPDEDVSDDEHFERMQKRDALLAKRGVNTRKGYGVRR